MFAERPALLSTSRPLPRETNVPSARRGGPGRPRRSTACSRPLALESSRPCPLGTSHSHFPLQTPASLPSPVPSVLAGPCSWLLPPAQTLPWARSVCQGCRAPWGCGLTPPASGCCSGDWGPGHPQSHVAQCGKVGIWGVGCPAGLLRHPPCLPPPPGPGALAGPLVILPRPRAPTCVCEVGATVPARPPSGPWGGEHQCGTVGGPHPRLAFLPFPRSRMETAITLGTGGGRAGTCSLPL